jgi:AraC family transcriptional activator of pyochelin receptor
MSEDIFDLDIREGYTALRDKTELPCPRLRQPEFQIARSRGFSILNEGVLGSMLESRAVQPYVLRYISHDYLLFVFTKHAHDMRAGPGDWQRVSGGSVLICAHTSSSVDLLRPAGLLTVSANLFVHRDALVDIYGLKVDRLPEQCRDVFRGLPGARFVLNIMISSHSWLAMDAIFRCQMDEPLKSMYQAAKFSELLTETVDMLNRRGVGGLGAISSKEARERRLIEEAAQIYRREMRSPPSVAELSLKLGINRNKLTDGFKEIFGASPGDYAKGIRLDWAKEQLAAGVFSIGELAYAIGYSNPSAFARAYGEHFGKPPSGDSRLEASFGDASMAGVSMNPPKLKL